MTASDLERAVVQLRDALLTTQVPFHFTGGVVASLYGEPRMTVDVNVVVGLANSGLDFAQFVGMLQQSVDIDEYSARALMKSHSMFQGLDQQTMFKFDFHIGERIPGELGRTVTRELFEGIQAPVVSPEDALLSKVLWHKMGSGKSRQDALMILKRQEPLDWALLAELGATLGVTPLLDELRREAAL